MTCATASEAEISAPRNAWFFIITIASESARLGASLVFSDRWNNSQGCTPRRNVPVEPQVSFEFLVNNLKGGPGDGTLAASRASQPCNLHARPVYSTLKRSLIHAMVFSKKLCE